MCRLIIIFSLLYTSTTFVMNVTKILGLATSPVTVPGTYYYYKTVKDQSIERPRKLYDVYERSQYEDMFRPFVQGVVVGVVPVINMIGCANLVFISLDHLSDSKMKVKHEKSGYVGFLSGLSLYATVPRALALLKK